MMWYPFLHLSSSTLCFFYSSDKYVIHSQVFWIWNTQWIQIYCIHIILCSFIHKYAYNSSAIRFSTKSNAFLECCAPTHINIIPIGQTVSHLTKYVHNEQIGTHRWEQGKKKKKTIKTTENKVWIQPMERHRQRWHRTAIASVNAQQLNDGSHSFALHRLFSISSLLLIICCMVNVRCYAPAFFAQSSQFSPDSIRKIFEPEPKHSKNCIMCMSTSVIRSFAVYTYHIYGMDRLNDFRSRWFYCFSIFSAEDSNFGRLFFSFVSLLFLSIPFPYFTLISYACMYLNRFSRAKICVWCLTIKHLWKFKLVCKWYGFSMWL